MDPLTTLLAAAAATGPNTLQSQALMALRSGGPQESFFTRMGNPHPLQMQQLAQPTTPQLTPIITQPTMAPTAFTQPLSMPTMPMASPLADPAASALHLPTLQAIHRMQQQLWCQQCPSFRLHSQQRRCQETRRSIPKPIFPHSPQGSWPSWHSWRCRTSKHCAAVHTMFYSPACRQWQGDLRKAWDRAIHSPPAPQPAFWRQDKTHNSVLHRSQAPRRERQTRRLPSLDRSRSHTRPQHRRRRRSRSHCRDRRSRSHGARRAHRHRPRTSRSRSPSRAFVLRSRSQLGKLPVPDLRLTEGWMTKWSYRAPPPQPTGVREGASQSSAATDGDESTFCFLHGLDPGDRSSTTATSIPIPAIQLHSGP